MELLKQHIKDVIGYIPTDELNAFCNYFTLKTFKKHSYILKQGEVCNFEGFITKGCCSITYTDSRDKSFTLYFAVEGMWVVELDSLLHGLPSQFSIQAIEDSEILMIHKDDKEKCYESMLSINKLFRIIAQQSLIHFKDLIIDGISKTAEERYSDFMRNSPAAHRLTNIQIATHLGVSREFISKIRRKRLEN